MDPNEINELARRQIRAAAEQTLKRAGVSGVVPTPLDVVSRAAGIAETIDVADLPIEKVARRPGLIKRVLGAIFYREKVIFVDRSQGTARGRFIEAHEISHRIIPAHQAFYRFDDQERVFGATKKRIDAEADMGAAELLFQGDLFVRMALDYEVSIAAPIGLAPTFGVSLTAAVRHYAVYHPDPVCVIVAGLHPRADGTVPVWGTHDSPAFRTHFGSAARLFPKGMPATESDAGVGLLAQQARGFADVASGAVVLTDLRGERCELKAEAFCNQRVVLVMLADARAARAIGRRISVHGG